jgi:hypothetical protein
MRYAWRGEVFPSVTTIIGGGIPKPALVPWAAKMTAEWVADNITDVVEMVAKDRDDAVAIIKGAPYKSKNRAAILGTKLHAAAEAHANGEPLPRMSAEVQPLAEAYLQFIDDYKPTPILTEARVYSPTFDYAGTLDAIVEINGEKILLDYKTGKAVYPEVALQLAAYRYADFYDNGGEPTELPEVDRCMVVHIRPQKYAVVPVTADENVFRSFRAVRKVYDFMKEGDKLLEKTRRKRSST